jgi:hypothetical protein
VQHNSINLTVRVPYHAGQGRDRWALATERYDEPWNQGTIGRRTGGGLHKNDDVAECRTPGWIYAGPRDIPPTSTAPAHDGRPTVRLEPESRLEVIQHPGNFAFMRETAAKQATHKGPAGAAAHKSGSAADRSPQVLLSSLFSASVDGTRAMGLFLFIDGLPMV